MVLVLPFSLAVCRLGSMGYWFYRAYIGGYKENGKEMDANI